MAEALIVIDELDRLEDDDALSLLADTIKTLSDHATPQQVLLAAALAPKGPLGHFTAGSVREPMARIMGEQVEISKFNRHLNAFTGEKRGRILEKSGEERGWFYRFRDPLLQPFVLLQGLARGQIDEQLIR